MLDPRALMDAAQKEIEPNSQKAAEVMELAQELAELQDRIDTGTKLLTELRARYDALRKEILPDLMHEAGMVSAAGRAKLSLADGRTVFLQSDMHVHIRKEDVPAFYAWLESEGHADLIVDYVHPSTLKAFAKEQLSEGRELPSVIQAHPYLKAVLRKG